MWPARSIGKMRSVFISTDSVPYQANPRGSNGGLGNSMPGREFIVVVPDTLTFRKLPALWLLVTLPEPLPLRATLDMLMRPMGTEPFTNHSKLPQQIATPAGFPPDCVIRTDDPQGCPPARYYDYRCTDFQVRDSETAALRARKLSWPPQRQ